MNKSLTEKTEALRQRLGLSNEHLYGLRFATNVGIATTIVWITLRLIGDSNPIWAIASMVASSDPQPDEARKMFKARLINVLVGCAVGLIFISVGGAKNWKLPFALFATVLISSLVIKVKTMWRQAPITAAVVIATGIVKESTASGFSQGLHKVAEVIFGCLVGLIVSWSMSKVWILDISKK